jgi:hypothetical protein
LLTAIAAGFSRAVLADALLAAETERAFGDTGHSLDFLNKAFKCLDLIGWQHAGTLLPTVVGQMAGARGAEESTAWRQPVDLVAPCKEIYQACAKYGAAFLRPACFGMSAKDVRQRLSQKDESNNEPAHLFEANRTLMG